MAVQKDKNRIVYPGNGVQDTFDFDFFVDDEPNELVVTRIDANNTEFELFLDADFEITVSSVDESGGTIRYPIAGLPLPVGEKIAIERLVAETQPKVLKNQGGFYLNSIEGALDRLTHLVQQLSDAIDRSVKFGVGSLQTGKVLPEPAAGAAIGWDNSASQLVNLLALSSSSTVSGFVDSLLDKADAAAFLTGLGVSTFIQTLLNDTNHTEAQTTLGAAGLTAPNIFTAVNFFSKVLRIARADDVGNANVVSKVLTLGGDGLYYKYTGTSQVDLIASLGVGAVVIIEHTASALFFHNPGNFILPRGFSRVSVPGDISIWYEFATGGWICVAWTEHTASVTEAGIIELASDAEAQLGLADSRAVTPGNLGSAVIGINSTYSFNVSLANNTERQNTFSKAKIVIFRITIDGSDSVDIYMGATSGALDLVGSCQAGVVMEDTITIMVPNNFYYKYVTTGVGTITVTITEIG